MRQFNLFSFIRKLFRQKITFLCIFHNPRGPIKINFSVGFLVFLISLWTIITGVSVYLSSRHIDYWSAKLKSIILKSKYEYVNQQLSKNWELLSRVQKNDEEIRKLLDMKSKKDIILKSDQLNQGGPSLKQSQFLQKVVLEPENVSIVEYNDHLNLLRKELEEQIKSYNEIVEYIKYQKELYRYTPMIWPCYGRVTSPFGMRIHPVYKEPEFHSGIDIANHLGTPVRVTADGVIKFVGWQPGYGKAIVVEHKFGYKTVYGHLSKIVVKPGIKVTRGTVIGYMGDTGTTTGVHLHYEVWKDDKLQNPIRYLDPEKFFKG